MYMQFYIKFILITICTYIINFITLSVEALNCTKYRTKDQYVISIHNLCKLITPLLQCVVIIVYYRFNIGCTPDAP